MEETCPIDQWRWWLHCRRQIATSRSVRWKRKQLNETDWSIGKGPTSTDDSKSTSTSSSRKAPTLKYGAKKTNTEQDQRAKTVDVVRLKAGEFRRGFYRTIYLLLIAVNEFLCVWQQEENMGWPLPFLFLLFVSRCAWLVSFFDCCIIITSAQWHR